MKECSCYIRWKATIRDMKILRAIAAIILGYAIFVISALLLFRLAGINPHAEPSTKFMIMSMLMGIIFSLLAGFVTQVVSKSGTFTANYFLGVIIASFAAFSMLKTSGNHYSQIAAIFLFAPLPL
jgi:hypothetical protein